MKPKRIALLITVVLSLILGFGVALPAVAGNDGAKGRESSKDDDREDSEDREDRRGDSRRGDDDDDDDDRDHDDDDAYIGSHSWSGHLCNGDAFTVHYALYANSVSVTGVDGPAAEVEAKDRGAEIKFKDSRARIKVSMKKSRSGPRVVMDGRLGHCGNVTTTTGPQPPATAAPTTAPGPKATTVTTGPTTVTTAPPGPPTSPTTPPPTTIPPPTTPPPVQTRYLTYQVRSGSLSIRLDPNGSISFHGFAANTGWKWDTTTNNSSNIGMRFQTDAISGPYDHFEATVSNGNVTAKYANGAEAKNGATIAPSSDSTVAPATSKASG